MDKHIAVTSPMLGSAAAAAPTPPALSLAASSSGGGGGGKARLTINTASIGLLTEALSSGAQHTYNPPEPSAHSVLTLRQRPCNPPELWIHSVLD